MNGWLACDFCGGFKWMLWCDAVAMKIRKSFFPSETEIECAAAALLCVHGIRRYTDGTNLETGTHNEVATYLIHTGSI